MCLCRNLNILVWNIIANKRKKKRSVQGHPAYPSSSLSELYHLVLLQYTIQTGKLALDGPQDFTAYTCTFLYLQQTILLQVCQTTIKSRYLTVPLLYHFTATFSTLSLPVNCWFVLHLYNYISTTSIYKHTVCILLLLMVFTWFCSPAVHSSHWTQDSMVCSIWVLSSRLWYGNAMLYSLIHQLKDPWVSRFWLWRIRLLITLMLKASWAFLVAQW